MNLNIVNPTEQQTGESDVNSTYLWASKAMVRSAADDPEGVVQCGVGVGVGVVAPWTPTLHPVVTNVSSDQLTHAF